MCKNETSFRLMNRAGKDNDAILDVSGQPSLMSVQMFLDFFNGSDIAEFDGK